MNRLSTIGICCGRRVFIWESEGIFKGSVYLDLGSVVSIKFDNGHISQKFKHEVLCLNEIEFNDLNECDTCGVVVSNHDTHREWHEDLQIGMYGLRLQGY